MYLKLGKNGRIFSTKYKIKDFIFVNYDGEKIHSSIPLYESNHIIRKVRIITPLRDKITSRLIYYAQTLRQRVIQPNYELATGYIYNDNDELLFNIYSCMISNKYNKTNECYEFFIDFCGSKYYDEKFKMYRTRLTNDISMVQFICKTITEIIDS